MDAIIAFLFEAIRYGTPLLYGTVGEIVTEKVGSLNLGVEGLMALGAIGGFWVGAVTDSIILGILAAFLSAALGGFVYAVLTVTFQANQNVTGLTLTIFGVGLYEFIGATLSANKAFPVIKEGGHIEFMMSDSGIPLLKDIPYIGKLFFSHNILVYLGLILAVGLWFYMNKTKVGLRLRATGENYGAADACGINVTMYRYLHIIFGAGISGVGGLYLGVIINNGKWNPGWINGYGWIAVALVIFAKWSTSRALYGSLLFGALTILNARKGNLKEAFPSVLGWVDKIPDEFYQMLPFVITLVVLVVSSITSKGKGDQPSCCGLNYYREDR